MRPASAYLDDVIQDSRVALRRMRRSPLLTTAIVLTIAIGLGSAGAIFTVFKAAILESLPYTAPEELAFVEELRAGTSERSRTSYATLQDWRARSRRFSALEGYDPGNLTVSVAGDARMLRGAQVTTGFFSVLGVGMSSGRGLVPGDALAESGVVVVSDRLANQLGGSRTLNATLTVNGSPHVVAGILPREFHFALLQDADVFVPLQPDEQNRTDRTARNLNVVGRLRPSTSITAARAELASLMTVLASEHSEALSGRTVSVRPLRDAFLGTTKPVLASLVIAVGLLLVIMAANLALLMLARHLERAPELVMRSALGATRTRLLRQLMAESFSTSFAGAAVAVVLGAIVVRLVIGTIPENVRIDMPYLANARFDASMVAGIGLLAVLLAMSFGLGPALLATSGREGGRLVDARSTMSRGNAHARRGLLAAQAALTVVLLVCSGLLVTSFINLHRRDLGFRNPETLVSLAAPLSGPRYQDAAAQQRFYEGLLARTAAVPGITAAALIDEVPGGGGGTTTFDAVDRSRPRGQQPTATLRIVGGDYFNAMGIRITAGRAFTPRDTEHAPRVAVVSEELARVLAQDGSGIGRRIRLSETDTTTWEVIGVVGNVQVASLDASSPPVVYLPHLQLAENRLTVVVRTALAPAVVLRQLREIVQSIDRTIPVYGASTLARRFEDSRAVFTRRLPMILCGIFAVTAFMLTLIALYASCMNEIQARRREFGIRLAVGSSPGGIRALVLGNALVLGVVGVGLGVMFAAAVARTFQAVLFGVGSTDWRVYAVVSLGTLASMLLATVAPAVRAGSVNPSAVLRSE